MEEPPQSGREISSFPALSARKTSPRPALPSNPSSSFPSLPIRRAQLEIDSLQLQPEPRGVCVKAPDNGLRRPLLCMWLGRGRLFGSSWFSSGRGSGRVGCASPEVMGVSPSRKAWIAVSIAELAIILILAAGLGHLATHHERGEESWTDSGMLASLDRVNQTLQEATQHWDACLNRTRVLEGNTFRLSSKMSQLNTRLSLKEFEIKGLEDEVVLLKNWTEMLQDVNKRQKEIIIQLQQQQKRVSGTSCRVRLHSGLALVVLTTGVFLLV
ncbi:uncharacterized protein LOC133372745 [Rhineura floridana]|uniref:uncharacterized protein LOC133372745 n=1 Tax=Rhineura floridana TaxID=261503 RepID=UPI002AC8837C|nr:uncharacterized protein LOC133372745 [Rhineura floridana]